MHNDHTCQLNMKKKDEISIWYGGYDRNITRYKKVGYDNDIINIIVFCAPYTHDN